MTSLAVATTNGLSLVERVRAAKLPSPDVRYRIRQDAGVTLEEIAAELGVSAVTVQRWERGLAVPRRERAIAYKCLLDELRQVAQ